MAAAGHHHPCRLHPRLMLQPAGPPPYQPGQLWTAAASTDALALTARRSPVAACNHAPRTLLLLLLLRLLLLPQLLVVVAWLQQSLPCLMHTVVAAGQAARLQQLSWLTLWCTRWTSLQAGWGQQDQEAAVVVEQRQQQVKHTHAAAHAIRQPGGAAAAPCMSAEGALLLLLQCSRSAAGRRCAAVVA